MKIPPCYMENKNATLNNPRIQGIRLYAPHIQIIKLPGTIEQFYKLASELNPQENERYQPGHGDTQCDAATGDFSDKCGCFLPAGFFWNDAYIAEHEHDQHNSKWEFKYKVNVHELSANGLYDWLIGKYSAGFGWERINTVTELQELANKGYLCIISGKNPKGHGHVCAVLPENKEKGMIAQRIEGKVFCPIIYQAGSVCNNWTNESFWFGAKQFKGLHGFFFNRGISE